MSHQHIPSPISQGLRDNTVVSFPPLDSIPFLGLSSHYESNIVVLHGRYIQSYSQDEFSKERVKALSVSNRKLWPLVLTILFFLSFVAVFTKGPTRFLALVSIARSHSAHLNHHSNSSTPLVDFQVSPPVYVPADADCKVTLMKHSFGNSYGAPFVGE